MEKVKIYLDELMEKYPIEDVVILAPTESVYLVNAVYWWTNILGEWSGEHYEILDGAGYWIEETGETVECEAADGEKWEVPVEALRLAPSGWAVVLTWEVEQGYIADKRYTLYVGPEVEVIEEDKEYGEFRRKIRKLTDELNRAYDIEIAEPERAREIKRRVHSAIRKLLADYIEKRGIRVLDAWKWAETSAVVVYGDDRGRLIYSQTFAVTDIPSDEALILMLLGTEYHYALEHGETEIAEKILKIAKKFATPEALKEYREWVELTESYPELLSELTAKEVMA